MSKAGKAVQEARWCLSVGSVGGSSLMPLSVVQGDHRGDAAAEEEVLPPSRVSRKSSAVLLSGLRVCWGRRNIYITSSSDQIIIFQHTSVNRNLNTELICLGHAGEHTETVNEQMSSKDSAQQLLTLVEKTGHTLQKDLSFSFLFK